MAGRGDLLTMMVGRMMLSMLSSQAVNHKYLSF